MTTAVAATFAAVAAAEASPIILTLERIARTGEAMAADKKVDAR
ncbi:hypothetical protein GCM10010924_48780 [Rhizobium wenxiniae]|jgi:hypothetical protein|uniref:Uncharacterized protein n=1 Tax=Rhizobium wenxiniae TaxID=1737357 RepID=A0A7W9YAX5_9HYPH|nr:hypothetical protein [Rhizobium wenxiniae]MBB6165242.1 hypothetical protein [Rhizobium wenxiniae]GGG13894.1 hypothetical protein GCM10010924_48780 [Rhizobium wenxiniae]